MTASFRRTPDFNRRADLIEAALDCIAELGVQGTTVRAVAAHAGVSNGLIRHHFASKDNLMVEAYRRTIEIITGPPLAIIETEGSAHEKLRRFILASISGPVAAPRVLSLWATFISQVPINPAFAEVHRDKYLAYRRACDHLIGEVLTAEQRNPGPSERQRLSIALNAVIDGLWLEGCLSAEEIDERLQAETGIKTIESLLDIKLG
ncbi:TetR family transcriptional regulator C-terminal domain-containing protein [Bosea sp. BIWAKO-01]|uniref:TetR family transcriptional regulator C-terminal domain-containing protein n=1 Tax=Bosea sp. BIWAKO-01 TaxID=506668 RepID=UPI000853D5D0|nr:TetR family transcriptional regulator C-terminal domain-containing protein [Bosea sp. BIWAKO-01]GAU86580.1 transcriptional regulator of TetR family [Bosea sp. BIWAKO-01]